MSGFSFPCVKVIEWLWFPEASFLPLGLEIVQISTQTLRWQPFFYRGSMDNMKKSVINKSHFVILVAS